MYRQQLKSANGQKYCGIADSHSGPRSLSNLRNSAEKLDPIAINPLSTIGVRLLYTEKEGDGKVKN
jgi:hypothetical protein